MGKITFMRKLFYAYLNKSEFTCDVPVVSNFQFSILINPPLAAKQIMYTSSYLIPSEMIHTTIWPLQFHINVTYRNKT